jgi:hypothetical protein
MRIVSGSTTESVYFVAFSTADHIARVTGLGTFNVYCSVAGSTGSTHAITVSEVNSTQMPGVYRALIADSTITTLPAGIDSRELCLHITSSMDAVTRTVELYRRSVTTGQTLAINTSNKIADVESILSKLTSVETDVDATLVKATSADANIALTLTKLTSVETDVDSVLTKVTSIDTKATAIQAQTTQFVFTQTGNVDANIQYVNNVQVNGVGSTANPWGP